VRDDDFAGSAGRDNRLLSRLSNLLAEGVAVVGLVGDERVTLDAFDHGRSGDDVVDLPAGQPESDRASQRVGEHMNLRGKSSSGTPERLILAPLSRSRPTGGRELRSCRASGIDAVLSARRPTGSVFLRVFEGQDHGRLTNVGSWTPWIGSLGEP
jgi:hypothetical protein